MRVQKGTFSINILNLPENKKGNIVSYCQDWETRIDGDTDMQLASKLNVDNHITAKLQIKTVALLFTSYILSCFEEVVQKMDKSACNNHEN